MQGSRRHAEREAMEPADTRAEPLLRGHPSAPFYILPISERVLGLQPGCQLAEIPKGLSSAPLSVLSAQTGSVAEAPQFLNGVQTAPALAPQSVPPLPALNFTERVGGPQRCLQAPMLCIASFVSPWSLEWRASRATLVPEGE